MSDDLHGLLEQLIESPLFKLYSIEYTVSLFSEERLKYFEELCKNTEKLHIYDFVKFSLMMI
jgi:hypothetical protein